MWHGITLLEQLVVAVVGCQAVERVSYATAFASRLGLDPHTATRTQLQAVCGDVYRTARSADDLLHFLWNTHVGTQLGADRPTIIYEFPAGQAALAEIRDGQPPVAERFELYWRGIELANGYHELRSADEFHQRCQVAAERRQAGKMPLPSENLLLESMKQGLPHCAGVALGVDRLLMLLRGEQRLDNVLSFAFSRA